MSQNTINLIKDSSFEYKKKRGGGFRLKIRVQGVVLLVVMRSKK